ncbi:IS66 family insertion sequence element accessory protein TnpB [Mesorhizobium sp. BR1-1-2]|nr:IS66 family insertion sequence element accessory protein TnpB [Mesorhizobium sp. BR1-1-2]
MVRETMGADPFSGAVYVFRAKQTDRIKLIFWAGTGVCIYAKWLDDGEFRCEFVHAAALPAFRCSGMRWNSVAASLVVE